MGAPNFSHLFSALFNCFVIIIFGYIAGRVNIITPTQGHGIGAFIGNFALPALIFKSMVELCFGTVSWTFLLAIFLAKTLVFIGVIIVAIFLMRRKGVGPGALYAIFATQSNDFALGYPIVKVLYGTSYPELVQYIYLLAPISLLILNPIGMFMLEIDKQWRIEEEEQLQGSESLLSNGEDCCTTSTVPAADVGTESSSSDERTRESLKKTLLRSLRGLFLNPIVTMVFLGLAFHFIFQGKIPYLFKLLLDTLGSAFSATALFYLGLSMVGKLGQQTGVKLFLPASLIIAKILILPVLCRELVVALNDVLPVFDPYSHGIMDSVHHNASCMQLNQPGNHSGFGNMSYLTVLANYGFLYGTFPTAPSVAIYAARYGLEVDKIAAGMVVCTTLSAPIMYVSAVMLTISAMGFEYLKFLVVIADRDISVAGLLSAVWCIAVFFCSKKFQRVPHLITTLLAIAMFIAALMSIISNFAIEKNTSNAGKFTAFFFMYFGIKASRLYTASLAITLVVYKYYGETKVRRFQLLLIGLPPMLAALAATLVLGLGSAMYRSSTNPVFMFGRVQDIVSFIVVLMCLIICIVSLVLLFRHPNLFEDERKWKFIRRSSTTSHDDYSERKNLLVEEELGNESDSSLTSVDEETSCWRSNSGNPQIARHILLLLLLTISLIIATVLTSWRVGEYELSGIYFEIGFLDSVFNFGQAFFLLIIFGFDEELILDPVMQLWHRVTRGSSEVSLTPLSEVSQEILWQCDVFVKHHLENCKKDLLRDRRQGLRTYRNVLTGADLCSWLVLVGLACDNQEAVIYGQHLMQGRVLQHVMKLHLFFDNNFLYQFENKKCRKIITPKMNGNLDASPGQENFSRATTGESPRRLRKCHMGRKQYSYERYLSASNRQLASTPLQRSKVAGRSDAYETESFSSEEKQPRNVRNDVITDVAHSSADILTRFADDKAETTEPQDTSFNPNVGDW